MIKRDHVFGLHIIKHLFLTVLRLEVQVQVLAWLDESPLLDHRLLIVSSPGRRGWGMGTHSIHGPPRSPPKNLFKAPSPNPIIFFKDGKIFSIRVCGGDTLRPALTTPVYSVDANVF